MQAKTKNKNKGKRTNTRKVKRGGDKKTFDKYVQTIIKHSETVDNHSQIIQQRYPQHTTS